MDKKCKLCGTYKLWDEFVKDKSKRLGYKSYCKICFRAKQKDKGYHSKARLRDKATVKYHADTYSFRKYGISRDQYNAMVANQGGTCAICNGSNESKRLSIDHDHKTGIVRGLLCNSCNIALGHFKDNERNLIGAILYLRRAGYGIL